MSSFAVPQFRSAGALLRADHRAVRRAAGTNPGVGSILAIVMDRHQRADMLANQMLIGKRKSYATVTGKSAHVPLFHLKKARSLVSVLVLCLVLCMSVVPLISFLLQSLIIIKKAITACPT